MRIQFGDRFAGTHRDHEKANESPGTTAIVHFLAAAAVVDLSSSARAYGSQPVLFLDGDNALFVLDLDYGCRSKP